MQRKSIVNMFFLVLTDSLCLTIAVLISHGERIWLDGFRMFANYDTDLSRYFFSGLLYVLLIFFFYFYGLYQKRNDFWEETRIIIQSVLFLFIFIAAYIFLTKTALHYSRTMVSLLFVNVIWLLPLGRVIIKRLLYRMGMWQINAYIDGNEAQAEKLRKDLEINWFLGYRPTEELHASHIVFIATRGIPVEKLERKIMYYKQRGMEVILIPYLNNISFANVDIVDLRIGRISMINIQNQLFRTKNILMKMTVEMALVIMILPLFFVLFVLIALLIKLDSRGPVLFRQKRLGQDGGIFECYKFRTMYVNGEELLDAYLKKQPDEADYYEHYHKYRNDPRITRAGYWLRKFSLDELPQTLNILKSEMSLIGPRPYMVEEKEKLGENADTILHVKPGITGFWQIKGRNDLTFAERVELDVWYIQNWSLWLDFIIFVKTFEVLLTRQGAR
jgi:lipopolysaccharide/colanic/teichoic acid biosynthesis glycosyltransferase